MVNNDIVFFDKDEMVAFEFSIASHSEELSTIIKKAADNIFEELSKQNETTAIDFLFSSYSLKFTEKDTGWIEKMLFVKTSAKKLFVDMKSDELYSLFARGNKHSLYFSENEIMKKIHYLNSAYINEYLVCIDSATSYVCGSGSCVIENLDELKTVKRL